MSPHHVQMGCDGSKLVAASLKETGGSLFALAELRKPRFMGGAACFVFVGCRGACGGYYNPLT
jgi:hypothetical protein